MRLIRQKWQNICHFLFKKKLPSAITILFFIIFLIIVISWIPGTIGTTEQKTNNNETIKEYGRVLGILDLFTAPVHGFISMKETIAFILIIGGFIGIVMKSEAIDAGIGCLVAKLNGKEIWLIPSTMLLLSIGGTVEGMAEETIPYYLILIPVFVAAGFDVITGVLVILLGAGVGVMFSTINPFAITAAAKASNIGISEGLIWRLICWICGTLITIAFVTHYALKVQKDPTKSVVYDLRKIHNSTFGVTTKTIPAFTKKRKIILTLFALTFLIMIFCSIPWDSLFYKKVDLEHKKGFFQKIDIWLNNHFPYFKGTVEQPGEWKTETLGFLFLLASLIIALIDWKGEENYLKDFIQGACDLVSVAFIIAVAGGVNWAISTSKMDQVILSQLNGDSNINNLSRVTVILMGLGFFLFMSFFIPSTTGLAKTVFPILSLLLIPLKLRSGMITTFSMASGWINLFAPTAGIMMSGLAIAQVPLTKYYRVVWPYMIIITIFIIVMLVIGSFLPPSVF